MDIHNRACSRRDWLRGTAAMGAVGFTASQAYAVNSAKANREGEGRIKHSICFWCFHSAGEKWSVEKTCQVANELGCLSIELIDPKHWPTLQKHKLTCAIASNGYPKAGFMYGLNNARHSGDVVKATQATIDQCADFGCPNVIAFVGYNWHDPADPKSGTIPKEAGFKECVTRLKELAAYGEKKGVTVCLEHLNTRDDTHPMKGHPGYMGDDLDFCAEIVKAVGSERVKLLFDIYHVQVMHGDLIRRLDQTADLIGHIHTAGNPGRGELDSRQEIFYPAVMRKLAELNYPGYVGHEFIPTRDAYAGLKEAMAACSL